MLEPTREVQKCKAKITKGSFLKCVPYPEVVGQLSDWQHRLTWKGCYKKFLSLKTCVVQSPWMKCAYEKKKRKLYWTSVWGLPVLELNFHTKESHTLWQTWGRCHWCPSLWWPPHLSLLVTGPLEQGKKVEKNKPHLKSWIFDALGEEHNGIMVLWNSIIH